MMTEWSGPLNIRPARVDDAKEIARIYNQGVQDRAATFENAYVTPEERYLWLAAISFSTSTTGWRLRKSGRGRGGTSSPEWLW